MVELVLDVRAGVRYRRRALRKAGIVAAALLGAAPCAPDRCLRRSRKFQPDAGVEGDLRSRFAGHEDRRDRLGCAACPSLSWRCWSARCWAWQARRCRPSSTIRWPIPSPSASRRRRASAPLSSSPRGSASCRSPGEFLVSANAFLFALATSVVLFAVHADARRDGRDLRACRASRCSLPSTPFWPSSSTSPPRPSCSRSSSG